MGTTERQSWLGLRTDHRLCHGGARTSGSSKEAAAATPTSAHTALPHPFPNLSEDSRRSVGETDAGWPPRPTHIPKGCCFSILLEKGKESPNKGTCRHWLPGNGDPSICSQRGPDWAGHPDGPGWHGLRNPCGKSRLPSGHLTSTSCGAWCGLASRPSRRCRGRSTQGLRYRPGIHAPGRPGTAWRKQAAR